MTGKKACDSRGLSILEQADELMESLHTAPTYCALNSSSSSNFTLESDEPSKSKGQKHTKFHRHDDDRRLLEFNSSFHSLPCTLSGSPLPLTLIKAPTDHRRREIDEVAKPHKSHDKVVESEIKRGVRRTRSSDSMARGASRDRTTKFSVSRQHSGRQLEGCGHQLNHTRRAKSFSPVRRSSKEKSSENTHVRRNHREADVKTLQRVESTGLEKRSNGDQLRVSQHESRRVREVNERGVRRTKSFSPKRSSSRDGSNERSRKSHSHDTESGRERGVRRTRSFSPKQHSTSKRSTPTTDVTKVEQPGRKDATRRHIEIHMNDGSTVSVVKRGLPRDERCLQREDVSTIVETGEVGLKRPVVRRTRSSSPKTTRKSKNTTVSSKAAYRNAGQSRRPGNSESLSSSMHSQGSKDGRIERRRRRRSSSNEEKTSERQRRPSREHRKPSSDQPRRSNSCGVVSGERRKSSRTPHPQQGPGISLAIQINEEPDHRGRQSAPPVTTITHGQMTRLTKDDMDLDELADVNKLTGSGHDEEVTRPLSPRPQNASDRSDALAPPVQAKSNINSLGGLFQLPKNTNNGAYASDTRIVDEDLDNKSVISSASRFITGTLFYSSNAKGKCLSVTRS